jgi:hypothetical protein
MPMDFDNARDSDISIDLSAFRLELASDCDGTSYYDLTTQPSAVLVINVACAATGTGVSICSVVRPSDFASKAEAAIQQNQTRHLTQACVGACQPFKLADVDQTRTFSGHSAVFLDRRGKVVPEGPDAVSKVDFDWSFDLRFQGEIGLCIDPDPQKKRTASAANTGYRTTR